MAVTGGNTQASLTWTAVGDATGYDIFRGAASGQEGTTPIAANVSGTTFIDAGLINGTTYYYVVTAVNAGGQIGNSNEALATLVPPPPTNLSAAHANAQVVLTWTATGAASYDIYRGTSSGGEGTTPIATNISGTTFTDTGLTNGTTYYYRVTAVNDTGPSGFSNETSIAPLPIPVMSSLPGAPATLYLNFGGDYVANWIGYTPGAIPAFDPDRDGGILNASDINAITSIWQIVAENYVPFDINVTTVAPTTTPPDGVAQIDIGGNGTWSGANPGGGIAQIGDFSQGTAGNPIRGFVFPDAAGVAENTLNIARGISHESGHTMGLWHQSQWSGTTLLREYYSGPGDGTAPIMGAAFQTSRVMWWFGTSSAGGVYQNDMAVIAGNYGYRPLATGGTPATAVPLTVAGTSASGAGVIEAMSQTDYWSFTTTSGGAQSFTVSTPSYGNLHPKFEIVNSSNVPVVGWQDSDSSALSWTGSLPAGTYYLVVSSHGISSAATATNYGFDVGSYSAVIQPFTLGTSPNAIYVANLYSLLLHRAADPGAAGWVGLLNQGVARSTVIQYLESSQEYLSGVVTGIYQHYLNRTPDPGGLKYWVSVLQSGASIEQVIQGFIASPEFYQVQGGNTNSGFVTVFYKDILGRSPDPSGYAYWLNQLNTGAVSRAGMAWGFLHSTEYDHDLVSADYLQFLRRTADSGGLNYWTHQLQAGLTDQAVLAALLGSAEGFADWS